MSDAGSHSSDELADEHTLEVPCVLCPTSPFPPGDAAPRCSVVVRRIRVDGFVHGGLGRWSQVYCGRILEADGLSPDDAPEPLVVVKLVDPLRFVPDEDNPDEEEPTEAARRMCVNEATAYAALVGVPVVPQWYGSYHVCMFPFCCEGESDLVGTSSKYKRAERSSVMYWSGSKATPSKNCPMTSVLVGTRIASHGYEPMLLAGPASPDLCFVPRRVGPQCVGRA